MAAHRYWRLTGFSLAANGPLELSEARMYAGGAPVDASATITSTFAPSSGALADLKDGSATGVVAWTFAAHSSSGFAIVWDLTGSGADVEAVRLGSGNSATTFPVDVTAQYSDDAIAWTTIANVVGAKYPGPLTLSPEPLAAADSFYANVSLLLHGAGTNGSTTFTDSSPSPQTVTPNGDAQISTAQVKYGGSSMAFDGTGDYLAFATNSDFGFGTGDFTLEGWYYNTAGTGTDRGLYDFRTTAVIPADATFFINTSNKLCVFNGTLYGNTGNTPLLNQWNHIAFSRQAGVLKAFLNGVQEWSIAWAIDMTTSRPLGIGGSNTPGLLGTSPWTGYQSDLRITKGVARYTADFAPPASAFPNSSGGDPDFLKVSLMLHADGANGSTAISDSSSTGTAVAVLGNAKISTAQSKFGGSSMVFDGSGDYLSIANHANFDFTSVDFTIEAWVYVTALTAATQAVVDKDGVSGASYSQYQLGITSTGKLTSFLGNGNGVSPTGTDYTGTTTVTLNAWHHIALVKTGSTCKGFLDGVQEWSAAAAAMFSGGKALLVGFLASGGASQTFNGYIDDLRITKGLARYTASFTPSGAPFPGASYEFIPLDLPLKARLRRAPLSPDRMVGSALPVGAARSHLRAIQFFDAYNGGIGLVYGTVKEKNTPANTPLRRRVLLIDEASRITIRETWSDAVTGNYEFRGVKQGVKYTVLSYDHTGSYRAAVADAQVPELIA
jgi:hypothetical protein